VDFTLQDVGGSSIRVHPEDEGTPCREAVRMRRMMMMMMTWSSNNVLPFSVFYDFYLIASAVA